MKYEHTQLCECVQKFWKKTHQIQRWYSLIINYGVDGRSWGAGGLEGPQRGKFTSCSMYFLIFLVLNALLHYKTFKE